MGIGGISPWSLLLILLIVVLLFGTKRLRGIGGDLGNALRSFKNAINEDESQNQADMVSNNHADVKEKDYIQTESLKQSEIKSKAHV